MEVILPKSIKKILFIDTETNNLPLRGDYSNVDLLEISLLLYSLDGNGTQCKLEREHTFFIAHPQNSIRIENSHIHGITPLTLKEKGLSIKKSIDLILSYIGESDLIVAHNAVFDINVLKNFFRKNKVNYISSLIDRKRVFDTMCDIPSIKRIKLSELHTQLFGDSFEGAHSALGDCRAMIRCFFEVCNINY